MKKAFENDCKTNENILQDLEEGKLPTTQEVSQLSATISDSKEYEKFLDKLRFAHKIELVKGEVNNDLFGYLLKRDGWPNTRDNLEKVLSLNM